MVTVCYCLYIASALNDGVPGRFMSQLLYCI